jgi:cytochrome c peroxidase
MFSPILYFDEVEGLWIGGQFWDGRATGEVLGDPLADQALGPFLNPLEMNNPNMRTVINDIKNSDYADLFVEVCGGEHGKGIFKEIEAAYNCVALSIAAFERTAAFGEFSSKYDAYLKGEATLTTQEAEGLALFEGKAMCSACHISEPGPSGEPPLLTDFTYDNLGVPKNPDNPFYHLPPPFNPEGADFVDYGLGAFLKSAGRPPEVYEPEMGKVKVMTLRNIADTGPYMHNGVFATLEEVVHFYNTRDVEAWPPPEVPENVNTDELGDLGLTAEEEAAIVAFLLTLSDGWMP